ncbi:hypothetical protein SteCoe_32700 [Stentor coeruleus]|uniref:CSC1/OSCA1-like 7TM region domain-containing protein n=1 Tax=Stentor coeruleus TaxID=5963 RepID=A0A1R2AYD7_9CILI|nr:hypothetical protein SteCoe_32700 [Stentor coeruleus]
MDQSFIDILTALGLDFLLFLLLIGSFLIYRKFRSPKINIELDIPINMPYMHEAEHSTEYIAKKVKNMSLQDIHAAIGEWSFLYLSFHKYIIFLLLIFVVLGSLLTLVYIDGNAKDNDDFHKAGISHLEKDSDWLLAPVIFVFIFSVVLYIFGFYLIKKTKNLRSQELSHQIQQYVIQISGFQTNYSAEIIRSYICKSLNAQYGDRFTSIYVVPQYIEAYKIFNKLDEHRLQLQFLRHDYDKTNVRPLIRKNCFKKLDGIKYHENKIEKYASLIEQKRLDYSDQNAGLCFIICKTRALAKEIIQKGLKKDPEGIFDSHLWTYKQGTSPGDLNWESIGINKVSSIIRRILVDVFFLLIFLIFVTPGVFADYIKKICDNIGLSSILGSIFSYYLPSLLVLFYQVIILPAVVEFMVNREKHWTKHSTIASGLRKYLFFLVFYTFLYPMLKLNFTDFVSTIVNNENDWKGLFAVEAIKSAEFFTVFLIHQAFLKNGWDLVVASKYIWSSTKALFAGNSVEKKLAYQSEPFTFDLEIAISLNTFIMVCSFSVIYPLILIPGILFFLFRYFIHKHNILAVFYVDKDVSALPSIFTLMFGIFLAAFFMQLLTFVTLATNANEDFNLYGKILLIASFCVFLLLSIWAKIITSKIESEENHAEYELTLDDDLYCHPMDKKKSSSFIKMN